MFTFGAEILPYHDFQSLVRLQINDVRVATYEAMDKPNRQYTDFWVPDEAEGMTFEMDDRFSFNDSNHRFTTRRRHPLGDGRARLEAGGIRGARCQRVRSSAVTDPAQRVR